MRLNSVAQNFLEIFSLSCERRSLGDMRGAREFLNTKRSATAGPGLGLLYCRYLQLGLTIVLICGRAVIT